MINFTSTMLAKAIEVDYSEVVSAHKQHSLIYQQIINSHKFEPVDDLTMQSIISQASSVNTDFQSTELNELYATPIRTDDLCYAIMAALDRMCDRDESSIDRLFLNWVKAHKFPESSPSVKPTKLAPLPTAEKLINDF